MRGSGTDGQRRRRASGGLGRSQKGGGASGALRGSRPSGSVLAVLLAGMVALGAGWWVRNQPPAAVQGPAKAATVGAAACVPGGEWVVQPGDTLWSVARRCLGDEEDTRYWVEVLRAYNGLPRGAALRPGQALRIPRPVLDRPAPQGSGQQGGGLVSRAGGRAAP